MRTNVRARCLIFCCLCAAACLSSSALGSPQPTAAAPCAGSAWHSFNFWLGEWDVFDAQTGTKEAHARIESILGGCAIHEIYDGVSGGKGESLSSWDDAHQVWRQYWVSGKGQIVSIEGTLQNGAIVLTGAEEGTHAPDLVRGIWKPENGAVRETALRSTDNGRTWKPWFDLIFRRSTAANAPSRSEVRPTIARGTAADQ
jgi:hypothetical protein